jgi:hypothetical protein
MNAQRQGKGKEQPQKYPVGIFCRHEGTAL